MANSFPQLILYYYIRFFHSQERHTYFYATIWAMFMFLACSEQKLTSFTVSICLFVCNELRRVEVILMKFVVDTFQFWLKSVSSNGYFT